MKEAFDKGQGNALMICPEIQKDLAECWAVEVTKVIKNELGRKNFLMLVVETRDCLIKEQMTLILT